MANVDRLSKLFHQFIHTKIQYVYTTKIPISPTLQDLKMQKCYRIFTLNMIIIMCI